MRKLMKVAALVTLLAGGFARPAAAAAILLDLSNPVNIPSLTGFMTTGAMMDGMSVTAFFTGGLIEMLAWADTGAISGGVAGSQWSVSQSGDTFDPLSWAFANTSTSGRLLTRLVLNGSTGLTVFDIEPDVFGTDGSALGRPFSTNLANDASLRATYRNPVGIGGAAPVGDLFNVLDVDFTGLTGGGFGGSGFLFSQDTDNDSRLLSPVPEPTSLVLLGTGLAALIRHRSKKRPS